MNLIAAGLGDRVDCCRGVMSVARGDGAGLDLEFLHRVREWQGQIQIVVQIVVIGAIQQVGGTPA